MRLMIIGLQGCGKGTQAKLLTKEFNLVHVSTGDLLREETKKETDIGKEIREVMNKGEHVSSELIYKLILGNLGNKEDYILDGFPRNMEQAELNKKIKFDAVIYLKLSEEKVLERLLGRLTCRKCGEIFHKDFKKPKEENKCDKCGGELYTREDETEDAIKERLRLYKEKTEPVIEYYREKGILMEVNGDRKIQEIFEDLKQRLRKFI